jgi:hypothetical protein
MTTPDRPNQPDAEHYDVPPAVGYTDPDPDPTDVPDMEQRPANMDDNDVAHFCVIPPGNAADFCGGCAQPWPCDQAVHLDLIQAPQD